MKTFFLISIVSLLMACSEQSADIATQETRPKLVESLDTRSVQVTDFKGSIIRLDQPAQRIVALAPHIVENVFTAGAGEQLIGVVTYSDYPPQATDLPIVGGYAKTNLEKILELKPDLVIAWESGNSDASVARIQELGFPVYIDQPKEIDDVAKSIRDIGVLSGTNGIAEVAAVRFLDQVNKLRSQFANKPIVKTFYQVWNSPLQTINGGHIISDAIKLCGGVNIYASESAIAPIVNIESILERDPEVIIASGMSHSRPEWLDEWDAWPSLTAVKSDNLYFVNPDHIQRHTARILNGIDEICKQFQEARSKRSISNNKDEG